MGISPSLGPAHEIDLPGGRVRYHETGTGAPVVFVHGLLVNADLWRAVVPAVAAEGYRCLTPDWPLGSHSIPVPEADLTPTGVADLIAAFLERLDLTDVTLVANDTGGAITQVLLARNTARIGRVVLASVDSHENFLPRPFTLLPLLARVPGSMRPLTETLRLRALHRLPLAFGWVSKRPVPAEFVDSYLLPSRRSGAIRKDLRRFLKSAHRRYTLDAATRFGNVRLPVLIVWAREDKLFPVTYAERLAREFPYATLELVDDSYTFLPEDQPELLTQRILEFTRLHATP
ncbi:Pimeloyl-ACP methyl ester carboxylesterase [Nocardia amikacinitolerans]|uniref:Pimeloyl-ACP methyl ester carboxylesterase n=1 Tax=Nocardia amikacinitolerans TaxID=756689 RepID=A0A285LEU1_9NOCA|nr:alpha/beta hydrolase [Nocardia amikacinitolerans]MCP2297348.1 Pimeloyl-ACP methyl ester carboxylesterase [Nocardia amikacinitolerans]SNY83382.1 Pimeloyl-ACP methyl ester carboxylesterase [Nocardia amikacinitolerans]